MSVQSDRVKALMQRVSYKPGWKMTVMDLPRSIYSPWLPSYRVVLVYTTQNANRPGTISTFTFSRDFREEDTDGIPDFEAVRRTVIDTIHYAEREEMDKWFRIDGFKLADYRENRNAPSPRIDPQLPRTDTTVC